MCLEISFAGLFVLLWFCRLGCGLFWLLLGSLPECGWLLGCLVTLICIVVAYLILVWSVWF